MPVWIIAAKAKIAGWLAALAAVLGVAGLVYVKGRADARERAAEKSAADALAAERAARARAENHTTVVREVATGVQGLPPSQPTFVPGIDRTVDGDPVVTIKPVTIAVADPKSAAGRLAIIAAAQKAAKAGPV